MSQVSKAKNRPNDTDVMQEVRRAHLDALRVWCEIAYEVGLSVVIDEDDVELVVTVLKGGAG